MAGYNITHCNSSYYDRPECKGCKYYIHDDELTDRLRDGVPFSLKIKINCPKGRGVLAGRLYVSRGSLPPPDRYEFN